MFIDKYREVINTSVHRIPERLKQIDKDYYLVRNHKSGEYEVHHSGQIGGSLALNVPFQELDCRLLELVKSTRIEYAQNIFREMERNNQKIEEDAKKKADEKAKYISSEIHKYASHHSTKETIDEDSSFLKEVI